MKVTNRVLENILTKDVISSIKYCEEKLVEATWSYNTTWNATIGFNPFELVYGKKTLLSIEFEYNTLRMVAKIDLDITSTQQERMLQLNCLDEFRMKTLLHTAVIQLHKNIWHEKHIT